MLDPLLRDRKRAFDGLGTSRTDCSSTWSALGFVSFPVIDRIPCGDYSFIEVLCSMDWAMLGYVLLWVF